MATRKKRSFDEMQAANLAALKAKKEKDAKKQQNDFKKELEKEINLQTKKRRKLRKRRKLTPEQLELKRAGQQAYKENPAAYFAEKFRKAQRAQDHKKAILELQAERQKENPDKFKGWYSYKNKLKSNGDYVKFFFEVLGMLDNKLNYEGMPICPCCEDTLGDVWYLPSRDSFKCAECKTQYKLTTDTILHYRKIPVEKICDLMVHDIILTDGLKAHEGAKLVEVSAKTAHFNLTKIRTIAFTQQAFKLEGVRPISIDTTDVSRKESNCHDANKLNKKEKAKVAKQVLVGQELYGLAFAYSVPNLKAVTMNRMIKQHVPDNSTVYTDKHKGFNGISKIEGKNLTHETNNHDAGEHGRGDITTNPVECRNGKIKKTLTAHGNALSGDGLQCMLNVAILHGNINAMGLTFYESIVFALKNIFTYGRMKKQAVVISMMQGNVKKLSAIKKLALAA